MNAQSVSAKLKNYSKKNKKIHQNTITKFFQERFLYRLGQSKYSNNFLLKGGALAYTISGEDSRHTKDIDFLIRNLKAEEDNIIKIISEICSVEGNDGVSFKASKIKVEDIKKEGNYQGIRIKVVAQLGKINQQIKIDIGIGDYVTPGPQDITYPIILEELPAPELKAYSIESLISEKFNAMIDLGEFNSRLKDFYDVYKFVKHCDKEILKEAITNTFERRKTKVSKNHPVFSREFYTNEERLKQWNIFLDVNQLEKIDFGMVHQIIKSELEEIYDSLYFTKLKTVPNNA